MNQKKESADFFNEILSRVSMRLYNCETIKIMQREQLVGGENFLPLVIGGLQDEYGIVFLKEDETKDHFLFGLMLEVVHKRCVDIFMCNDKTEKMIKHFSDDIYTYTCAKLQTYFWEKLKINFEDITAISSLYYEGAEVNGDVYFILDEIPSSEMTMRLYHEKDEVVLRYDNWRKIRKLLEISNISDENRIGLAFWYNGTWKMKGFTSCLGDNVKNIHIKFIRHMAWEMRLDNKPLVTYSGGQYTAFLTDNEKQFAEAMSYMEHNEAIRDEKIKKLWPLVKGAIEQSHGTILVIIFDYEESKAVMEVERIRAKSPCTRVLEGDIEDKTMLVKQMTTVDGALIVNDAGEIIAYGVILDSKPDIDVEKDSSRGSRFHSAKKYITSKQCEGISAIAVIVSEDGMVNYYTTKDAEKTKRKKDENRH